MSRKCRAFSASKLGLAPADNRAAFYAGWEAALEQPEQEPVAWMYHGIRFDDTPHDSPSLIWRPEYMDVMSASKGAKAAPLYTHPPRREWRGLTEEERNACLVEADPCECLADHEAKELMRSVEAALKEKNG